MNKPDMPWTEFVQGLRDGRFVGKPWPCRDGQSRTITRAVGLEVYFTLPNGHERHHFAYTFYRYALPHTPRERKNHEPPAGDR